MKYYLHLSKISTFFLLILFSTVAFGQAPNAKAVNKELKSVMKELPADMRVQVLEYAKRKLETKKRLDSAKEKETAMAVAKKAEVVKKPQQAMAKPVPATPKPKSTTTPQAIELNKKASPTTKSVPKTTSTPAKPSYMQEAQSLPTTRVEWGETTYNFGTVVTGKVVKHQYTFKNVGEHPLKLTRVKASCGCTTPAYSKKEIAPGEEGFIDVSFNSSGKSGPQTKTITVTGNFEPVNMVLKLRGTLQKAEAITE